MASPMSPQEQFQALNTLDYLSDLFTATEKKIFTQEEILIVLDNVRSDADMFDRVVLIAQQMATADLEV